ncbi:adenylate/guanylate cyclase domain-containing protein [Oxynema sp. CENA135]|jgi:adenylate cyclase|uniref:adenylate/guanylate cyclase domain-containing protein n=1 Tax=Oxynema sp. CENA135 TaxID=984206 RepID=UPI001F2F7252|nr:adenylate/guanylate cyclase domain-containing protein [Oxynema sp. CENA135]
MKKLQPFAQSWRKLNITGKFTSAFIGLMLLLSGVALTGWVSLNFVRRETEAAIVTSLQMQRLVFQMNAALDRARRQERDFFEQWSSAGFLNARDDYAAEHGEQIQQVLRISDELQKLLASAKVSDALRQSNPDVIAYVEMVQNYASSFKEAVALVGELGMDRTGVLSQLEQKSDLLLDTLQLAGESELIALYSQMQASEKQYLLERETSARQGLYKAVEDLRDAIVRSPGLDVSRQVSALEELKDYEAVVEQIVMLDVEIRSQVEGFDRQAAEVSDKLLSVVADEVERARSQIAKTSRAASWLLVAALLAAVILASAIAQEFVFALRQLEIEQAKSERLLLNILPETIADRLKQKPETIADNFTEVTILFADIVGFTKLSARVSPTELVNLLNEIFSEFDGLADRWNLEKIKTIGDAYMVVGGLPDPSDDHAASIAEMALDMQAAIAHFNEKYANSHDQPIDIRIGINTGAVVAGVIGQKKFIYDLWGDAVNTASRMESHGIPGSIQVSASTYELLQNDYIFEDRGVISVKGKGEMKTYLLVGRKVETPIGVA